MSQRVQFDEMVSSGQLSLVMFQPDAVSSCLIGAVERWLRERTGCVPIARRWVTRSEQALARFYPDVAGAPFWPLVARVFGWGPCLATLWWGERAAQALPASKGVTQPARCAEDTVRGRFWCDNALTNLIHVSDAAADVAREVGVLRSSEPELFREPLPAQGLPAFTDPGAAAPGHSAVWALCSLLMKCGAALPALTLPADESARATMARAEAWLQQARTQLPAPLAAAVSEYLAGTCEPQRLLGALKSAVQLTEWQELVLTGGALSRPEWAARSAASAPA